MVFVPKAWRDIPDRSTPINAAALIDMETRLGAYADTGDTAARAYADAGDVTNQASARAYTDSEITKWASKTLLTPGQFLALPAQPDGTAVRVQAEVGVNWRFRLNAGSASAYKWEFEGGPALWAEHQNDSAGVTSTTYVQTTPVVAVGVQFIGEFDFEHSVALYNSAVNGLTIQSLWINGTASDADSAQGVSATASALVPAASGPVRRTVTALNSSVWLVGRQSGGTGTFRHQKLSVVPKRIQGP